MYQSDISLASMHIDSSSCTDVICGSNGLPITPNSIKIIGDFKAHVERVSHPNLVRYVECFRNKNERVTLVYENLPIDPPGRSISVDTIRHILDALDYMHNSLETFHGLITPECFVWSGSALKLAHWPINLLTASGKAMGSMSILPKVMSYLAPEQIKNPRCPARPTSDIWSASLTLLKLIKPSIKLPDNPCRLAFCETPAQVIKLIEGQLEPDSVADLEIFSDFFRLTLHPDPNLRASLGDLYSLIDVRQPSVKCHLSEPLDVMAYERRGNEMATLNISEIYYLWRLSLGRNFESEQKQDDCPPIFRVPYVIVTEEHSNDTSNCTLRSHTILDTTSKHIPLDKFRTDIEALDVRIFHPLILTDELEASLRKSSSTSQNSVISRDYAKRNICESFTFADLDDLCSSRSNAQISPIESSKSLPIVIKEADFAYQCERIVLFKRLINGGPYLDDRLKSEAAIDIPPYYRAETWAILLGVSRVESKELYDSIDKTVSVAADRQISVDIPRCHQYNELMASPQGHDKLARILKAWLNHNSTEYVYWQGLDSLAAPFLLLNFDNEAVAFACFNSFVDKYLKGFFKKDNQEIVQEYLSRFSALLSYHDATLACHLEELGFLPNLYAIPWFLTMFTHVLPLHKVLHVWDCLLQGDEKFPLCIGLAILNQLREDLLQYNFNDCIVAFSDLPEIDIERCIRDATNFYNTTPDKLIQVLQY